MIAVSELSKRFGNAVAVEGVSFEVHRGEILGFLGPNGAGKTTTMRILTCFLPPSGGQAQVNGHDIHRDPVAVRRCIGYLPENVPLYTEMRVHEYLGFRARLKGVRGGAVREQVQSAVERCWLADVDRKVIGTLSKGYRQRVGLADALLGDPPVLILDEPTVGLDPNQVREVRGLIRDLAKNHTVILSTHILSEVEVLCDRVIIIAGGRLVLDDTLTRLKASFERDARFHAEIHGPPEAVRAALEGLPGVRAVSVEETGAGPARYVLETDQGRDVRDDLFARVTESGWRLRELHREVRTLEEVFVRATARSLTRDNGSNGGGA